MENNRTILRIIDKGFDNAYLVRISDMGMDLYAVELNIGKGQNRYTLVKKYFDFRMAQYELETIAAYWEKEGA